MTVAMQQLILTMQRIADAFHEAVYSTRDLDGALAMFDDDATLESLPLSGEARSGDELRRHLAQDVLPHLPSDLTFRRVSRTADIRRLADERVFEFTHDRELPWLLPGAAPTHRRAEVRAVSLIGFRHRTRGAVTASLMTSHRTLWDHSALMSQLHLHPTSAMR